MRAGLILAMICVTPIASADVSVADSGVATDWAACVAALRAALRTTFPDPPTGEHEHSCTVDAAAESLKIECDGACIDRSGHNDACEAYDEGLRVSLRKLSAASTQWTSTSHGWRVVWQRQYGTVSAEVVRYGERGIRRVSNQEIRKVRRALDRCVATLRE